ncbi:hypothetical protein RhiJN_21421 [Ceratobasidium sp. AG-Ba]|nr:hypothetical protein RhiJN_21421 [Ceratobasidium sp. AG-Ba]
MTFCTDLNEGWDYDDSTVDLPEDAFPSLRHLRLHGLDKFTMSRLCKAAPLFRHLVSAVIIFKDQPQQPQYEAAHNPASGNNGSFVVSWPVVEMLMQMTIRSLDLGEVYLDSGEYEEIEGDSAEETSENTRARSHAPPVEWRNFLSSVLNLEELRIERQEIQPSDLRLIASMLPHLRLLIVGTVPLGDAAPEHGGDLLGHRMVLSSWSFFKHQKQRAADEVPDIISVLNAAKVYKSALPTVWQEAELFQVLRLVPELLLSSSETANQTASPQTPPDLTRFHVHSPLIRTLRFHRFYVNVRMDEFRRLGNPVLPNLRCLIITQNLDLGWELGGDSWHRFLTPCLRDILMLTAESDTENSLGDQHDGCSPSSVAITDLLNRVSDTCPRLETIRFFLFANKKELYSRFLTLSHLRSVSLVVSRVNAEMLGMLGQLSNLERLTLRSSETKYGLDKPIVVSNDSFPSLRYLSIYALHDRAIEQICNIPQLFRHIVSFNVVFAADIFNNLSAYNRRCITSFKYLGQKSPNLVDLSVRPRGHKSQFMLHQMHINAFMCMNLRQLSLDSVNFGSLTGDEDVATSDGFPEHHWTLLLSSLPQLEELYLERERIPPKGLRVFAALLPRLQLLLFERTELDRVKAPFDEVGAPQRIVIQCWNFLSTLIDRGYRGTGSGCVSDAARYLYALWPNVVCEAGYSAGRYVVRETPPILNQELQALRLANGRGDSKGS